MNAAINIGVEDMTATIVRYGLYMGAIFQLICLIACVVLPESQEDNQWLSRVNHFLFNKYIIALYPLRVLDDGL